MLLARALYKNDVDHTGMYFKTINLCVQSPNKCKLQIAHATCSSTAEGGDGLNDTYSVLVISYFMMLHSYTFVYFMYTSWLGEVFMLSILSIFRHHIYVSHQSHLRPLILYFMFSAWSYSICFMISVLGASYMMFSILRSSLDPPYCCSCSSCSRIHYHAVLFVSDRLLALWRDEMADTKIQWGLRPADSRIYIGDLLGKVCRGWEGDNRSTPEAARHGQEMKKSEPRVMFILKQWLSYTCIWTHYFFAL